MFEFCVHWFAWGLDTSLKAVIIAGLAVALLRLLRWGDSNIRHRVWTGVLAGMLLLPLLAPYVPALRLPLVPSPDALLAWTNRLLEQPAAETPAAEPSAEEPKSTPTAALVDQSAAGSGGERFGRSIDRRDFGDRMPPLPARSLATLPADGGENRDVSDTAARVDSAENELQPAPSAAIAAANSRRYLVSSAVVGLAGIWLLGSTLLAFRLIVGMLLAARLKRGSTIVSEAELPPIGLRSQNAIVITRECSAILAPLTIGAMRPQILLPAEWRSWSADKVQAVLAHETMHVERGDCLVALLAEINCCLYWFHPLAWWLKRHLASLAEQVCDDAAIDSIGDRARYARHLLEVAATVSRSRTRLAPAGLSMARSAGVETRILSILDFSRPLSQRLSWAKGLLLLGIIAPLILFAAAIRPKNEQQTSTSSDPSVIRGCVVDVRGRAVAGAKIHWLREQLYRIDPLPTRLLATTNAAGEFAFTLPANLPDDPTDWLPFPPYDHFVVTAPGHGFATTSLDELRDETEPEGVLGSLLQAVTGKGASKRKIKLPAAGEPIRGRLINIEGQPVVGATVKIRWFETSKPSQAWRAVPVEIPDNQIDWPQRVNELLRATEPVQLRDFLPQAKTDAAGRFELRDVGDGRLFQLLVQGEQMETVDILDRNQAGAALTIPPEPNFRDHEVALQPRDFIRALGPSKPITGRVVDFDTGEPIAGAVVRAYGVQGSNLHSSREREEFAARTDVQGRYQIAGLPIGKENCVVAFARGDVAYVPVGHEFDTSKEDGNQHDFRLKRGVWAVGRAYDAATDQPLVGELSYYWFHNDELEKQFPGLSKAFVDDLYWTNATGEFRLPVLPSRGILAFRAAHNESSRQYPRGGGADAIAGAQSMGALPSFPTFPHYLIAVNYTRVAEVNPEKGAEEIRVNLPLTASQRVSVRVVDAGGKPMAGCEVYGANEQWGWENKPNEDFVVEDLRTNEHRKVLAFHRDRNLAGGVIVKSDDPQPVVIKLVPAGTLTGRLVDDVGEAITDATLHADLDKFEQDETSGNWANHPTKSYCPDQIPVDDQGRFQLVGLIPGWTYNAWAYAPRKLDGRLHDRFSIGRIFDGIRIEPGEKKDLGDLRPNEEKDDPEPAKPVEQKAPPPTAEQGPAKPARAGQSPVDETSFTFAGTAVDDRGQPVAGAVISLGYSERMPSDESLRRLAITDTQGRFEFTRKLSELSTSDFSHDWAYVKFIATKDGYGFGIGPVPYFETSGRLTREMTDRERQIAEYSFDKPSNQLTLPVDDVPILGRVVDSEGWPVRGAKVEVYSVLSGVGGNLDRWEEAAKVPIANDRAAGKHLKAISHSGASAATGNLSGPHGRIIPTVHADADGRFTLRGIGRERIVEIFVSGPGVATLPVHTRSRRGDVLRLSEYADQPSRSTVSYQPADFTCVLGPSVPVEGRVTDKNTKKPLAGMVVQGHKIATDEVHGGYQATYIHALTDADGRFRLEGLPLGDNQFRVMPAKKSPYLVSVARASLAAAAPPLVQDVALTKGVWVRGRATDSLTGTSLQGSLSYFAFDNNLYLEATPGFDSPSWNHHTDAEGNYEIPVLPGPGILAFNADEASRFPRGVGADKIDGPKSVTNAIFFLTAPHRCMASNYHFLSPLNPAADAEEVKLDLSLTPGKSLTGRVVGLDGKVLDDYYLLGGWGGWHRQQAASFEVKGYVAAEGRRLRAFDPVKNLVGQIDLAGEVTGQVEIVLQPGGTLVGRVVDDGGLPIEGLSIGSPIQYFPPGMMGPSAEQKAQGALITHLEQQPTLTDKNGRFELKGILPGRKYSAGVSGPQRSGGRSYMMYLGYIFKDVTIEPGQTDDLGDLRIKSESDNEEKPDEKQQQPPAAPKPEAAKGEVLKDATNNGSATGATIRGRVVDANGQVVAGATVHSYRYETHSLDPQPPRLVATTDAAGEFSVALPDDVPAEAKERFPMHTTQRLLVAAPGHGFMVTSAETMRNQILAPLDATGRPLAASAANAVANVRLPAAGNPIRGRLVNIDGQPIVGATIKIRWFEDATRDMSFLRGGAAADQKIDERTAWIDLVNHLIRTIEPVQLRDILPTATTDAEGRFELRDLGANRLFRLLVESEQAEAQDVVVRNQLGAAITIPPDLGLRDKELVLYPQDFVHALGPSQPFTGRVLDRETGEPISGALIRAFAVSYPAHIHIGTDRKAFDARTDAQGRYRISGLPTGKGLCLVALTTGDIPYIPLGRSADFSEGEATSRDFRLQRGIWATGRVFDAETKRPLIGYIDYFWFEGQRQPEPGFAYAHVAQLHRTNTNGEFRVPILPTRGVLGFHFPWATPIQDGLDLYPDAAGVDSIEGHDKVDRRGSFDAIPAFLLPLNYQRLIQIKPQPDAAELHVDLPLTASQTVQVRVVDSDGQPVAGCEVNGVTEGGLWDDESYAEFSIKGMTKGERRKVMAFHRGRNLAGGAIVSHADKQPVEIKLVPAGSFAGRLVDRDGEPITDGILNVDYDKLVRTELHGIWANDPKLNSNPTQIPTDSKGRFQLDGLIPGWSYSAYVTAPKRFIGKSVPTFTIGNAFTNQSIAPGQTKNLGDLLVKPEQADEKEVKPSVNEKPTNAPAAAPATADQGKAENTNASGDDKPQPQTAVSRLVEAAIGLFNPDEQKPKRQARTLRGRVVDPAGKPLAGVALRMQPLKHYEKKTLPEAAREEPARATTDKEGRFAAEISGEERGYGLLVFHPGFGVAYVFKFADDETDFEDIVLRPERPIAGRFIDAEGRPIVGASVEVKYVYEPHGTENLDKFLTAWKRDENDARQSAHPQPVLGNFFPESKTDQDGRFVLSGTASECVFVTEIKAPGYGLTTLWVVNRPGFDASPYNSAREPWRRTWLAPLAGNDFTHVCLPDYRVAGRVLDGKGKPIAGARVRPELGFWPHEPVTTDKDGRYTIAGLPRGKSGYLNVEAPSGGFLGIGGSWLNQRIQVSPPATQPQLELDVTLAKGVQLTGRVTDPLTGAGVPGWVSFLPLVDNDHANKPGYKDASFSRSGIGDNGYFSLTVMPGPGVITMQAQVSGPVIGGEQLQIYRTARFSAEDRPHIKFYGDKEQSFLGPGQVIQHILSEQYVKYVNFKPASLPQQINFQLDRGKTAVVEFVDEKGQPVENVFVAGIAEHETAQLTEPRTTIYALAAATPRKVIGVEPTRGLLGSAVLTGDEKAPVRITLTPSASFRGRAVDEQRHPLVGQDLLVNFDDDDAACLLYFNLPQQKWTVTTDDEGRFEMRHVVSGSSIRFAMHVDNTWLERIYEPLQPGQSLDLGNLVLPSPKR